LIFTALEIEVLFQTSANRMQAFKANGIKNRVLFTLLECSIVALDTGAAIQHWGGNLLWRAYWSGTIVQRIY
jgi:hypothetical protein